MSADRTTGAAMGDVYVELSEKIERLIDGAQADNLNGNLASCRSGLMEAHRLVGELEDMQRKALEGRR